MAQARTTSPSTPAGLAPVIPAIAFLAWLLLIGRPAWAAAEPPDCSAPEGWSDTQRLAWPTGSRVTSQRFNDRHRGLDIETGLGAPVWASANGTIEKVDFDPDGYGRYLLYTVADAQPGMSVLYGHLEQALVGEGAPVQSGMLLGLAGSTGNSTKPHLHYEVRCAKSGHVWYMDPLFYLQKVWWPEWQSVEVALALLAPPAPEPAPGAPAIPTSAGPSPFGSVIVLFPESP